jgi:aminoglycoside/choline kinase family phosphotransferase
MPELPELQAFAENALGRAVGTGAALLGGGSARRFYRFSDGVESWVGVIAGRAAETRAFLAFTRHFAEQGLPVPRLFAADEAQGFYLMEDLGDMTLARQLALWHALPIGRVMAAAALNRVVGWLPRFQVHGGQGLDYALCGEGSEMDGNVFAADIKRFLEEFVPRHAARAEPGERVLIELEVLISRLDGIPREHFCYRDFQARNIMWREGPVFLDYQAGRRGALQYDLASLLYSPDSRLAERERAQLIQVYLKALGDCGVRVDQVSFLADFHPFVLVRRLQALGAYARLAGVEGKADYLKKIPAALNDLGTLLQQKKLSLGLPTLEAWLKEMIDAVE